MHYYFSRKSSVHAVSICERANWCLKVSSNNIAECVLGYPNSTKVFNPAGDQW